MIKKLLLFSIRHLLFSSVLPQNIRKSIKKAPGVSNIVGELERTVEVEKTLRRYLLYFLLPLWMGAGLLDWYYHRRTKIEKTAGTHESMIHALMMSEAGLPLLVGLYLDINALVLALMIVAFFLHEATAYWDVAYAEGLREVTPNEQHVHSFLEVIPFMAVSFMICLHWDQFCALVGAGDEPARFELRPKQHPLSKRYTSGLLTAVAATVALPYTEEFLRCYRVDSSLKAKPSNDQRS